MSQARATAIRLNLLLLSIARNWLAIALTILAVYVSLPFIAPTLMHLGLDDAGRAVYSLYTPMCHRFGFRSFFLYGEQPAYPLAEAGSNLPTYESYVGRTHLLDDFNVGIAPQPPFNVRGLPEFSGLDIPANIVPEDPTDVIAVTNFAQFQLASSSFLGNERMGWKMTLCERDIAIYGALLIGGLIYRIPFVRRRLRPVPLWLYVLLGILPIAIDGGTQYLGYPPFNVWEPRETIPFFRVLTGATFGLMNAWLGFVYIEQSMKETQYDMEYKLVNAGIIDDPRQQPATRD